MKRCISLAVDSIGLGEMPSYEVVVQNHIDWIKATQVKFAPLLVFCRTITISLGCIQHLVNYYSIINSFYILSGFFHSLW